MKILVTIISFVLILCFIIGCQNKEVRAELEAMKTQAKVEAQNLELVNKVIAEYNKRNLEFLVSVNPPDYDFYSPSGISNPISLEKSIEEVKMLWEAFPDITLSLEESIAAGDKVISRLIFRGTHQGEFQGIPATGKKIEFSGINIMCIKNNKIVEEWSNIDRLGLMTQLGMELKPIEK